MSLKFFAHFNSCYDFNLSDVSQKSQSGIKKPRNTNVPRYWQRYKDSNLKWRSQSPECYRYTIPLYSVGKAVSHCWIILAYSEEVVKKKWEFLNKKFGSSQRRRSAAFVNGKFFAHGCGFWCSALHNRRIFAILKQEIPAGSGIFIFAARPALFS